MLAKEIIDSFPGKTVPDCAAFPNSTQEQNNAHEFQFNCPKDYTGCLLRTSGTYYVCRKGFIDYIIIINSSHFPHHLLNSPFIQANTKFLIKLSLFVSPKSHTKARPIVP
jgi:hypothetical protein